MVIIVSGMAKPWRICNQRYQDFNIFSGTIKIDITKIKIKLHKYINSGYFWIAIHIFGYRFSML